MTTRTGIAEPRFAGTIAAPSFPRTIAQTIVGLGVVYGVWATQTSARGCLLERRPCLFSVGSNAFRDDAWGRHVVGTMLAAVAIWAVSLISFVKRGYSDASIVDKLWSLQPPAYCWHLLFLSGLRGEKKFSLSAAPPRLVATTVLATLWGARLTANFAIKGGYAFDGEDYRWATVRRWFQGWRFEVLNLVFVCLFQETLLLAIAAPAFFIFEKTEVSAQHAPTPWAPADTALFGAFLLLLAGETLADAQMFRFQSNKWRNLNKRRELSSRRTPESISVGEEEEEEEEEEELGKGFLDTGLWAYSRHPNYACEIGMWWVFYLLGARADGGRLLNWTILGPVFLTALFAAPGASIDVTEALSSTKYAQYADYQKRVPRLLPFRTPRLFSDSDLSSSSSSPPPRHSKDTRRVRAPGQLLGPRARAAYVVYFASHVPTTLLVDAQAVLPARCFPRAVKNLLRWHVDVNDDDLMRHPPLWLRSMIWCELLLQLPFFCLAVVVLLRKSERAYAPHFRVYAAHVATTLVPILSHFAADLFETKPDRDAAATVKLLLIYAPYLLVPLSLFLAFPLSLLPAAPALAAAKEGTTAASSAAGTKSSHVD